MEDSKINDCFWNIEDLSIYLKVKTKTLYAMVREIPHYRVGKLIRFKKEEIEAWMENNRVKSQANYENTNGKRKSLEIGNLHIDRLIRKSIDQTKQEGYNPAHGKSDRIEGPRKEINHGSI